MVSSVSLSAQSGNPVVQILDGCQKPDPDFLRQVLKAVDDDIGQKSVRSFDGRCDSLDCLLGSQAARRRVLAATFRTRSTAGIRTKRSVSNARISFRPSCYDVNPICAGMTFFQRIGSRPNAIGFTERRFRNPTSPLLLYKYSRQ